LGAHSECLAVLLHNPEHSAGQSDDIRPPDPEYPATLGMPS
jgi:hypothetical protein